MIAVMVAMALAAAGQGEGNDPPPRMTVEEWRKLPERKRSVALIGGIEGLMLAASGPRGVEAGVDQSCLGSAKIPEIVAKLSDEATPSGALLVTALLEASGCML